MKKQNDLQVVLALLISLILTGVIGYMILMDLSIVDALYVTVITISTVGYGEIGVMGTEAKMFSIILIFVSLGTVGYLFSTIVSSLLEGDIRKAWRRKTMETKIRNMKDHYIICGAGETGYNAIKQFVSSNAAFLVIEKDMDKVHELMDENIPVIHGDAVQEAILEEANIRDSKGLISSLSSDAENVYTVLTARQMNEDLYIVSRSINKNSDGKLKKARANNTISPNQIGGTRMASLMLRPNVISFLDIITKAGEVILDLEDVVINKNSELMNQSLIEAKIPQRTGGTTKENSKGSRR